MDTGLDLSPIPGARRTASVLDILLLFAGANIVTTTLVTGGSLAPAFSFSQACVVIVIGSIVGTGLLALLARLGPRFGLPTMVLLRHPFGRLGAAGISALLVLTNFAWIALNNVIAAQALSHLTGGPEWLWNLGVGAVAVVVASTGPRAMALFDRVAVPMLIVVGLGLSIALFGEAGREALARPGSGTLGVLLGLDIVVGYQVSWSLMFADYTRYQRRENAASLSVFLGMTLSSAWLMTVGAGAGLAGGGNDPTSMILGLGLPAFSLLLMALSTITTNFVNLYLSSLAVKNLWSRAPNLPTVLAVGVVGTGFGLASPEILGGYAGFMGWIGTLLLPIVAVVAIHFFRPPRGGIEPASAPFWRPAAWAAWFLGVVTYQAASRSGLALGATIPTLVITAVSYAALRRSGDGRAASHESRAASRE